jgi:hypothetical protein
MEQAMKEVTITVSGPVGSGKSAICGEIEILCRALGLQVEWADGQQEKNLTHADWTEALEMYKPSVKIVEQVATPPASREALTDPGVEAFLDEVRAELIRARSKFPGDRIMTIALAEEFGELCKAILDESSAAVRKEAVQTAVMCARVVLDGDGSVVDWRKERGLDPLLATAAQREGEKS